MRSESCHFEKEEENEGNVKLGGAQRDEAHLSPGKAEGGSHTEVSGPPLLSPRAGGSQTLDQEPSWLLTPSTK